MKHLLINQIKYIASLNLFNLIYGCILELLLVFTLSLLFILIGIELHQKYENLLLLILLIPIDLVIKFFNKDSLNIHKVYHLVPNGKIFIAFSNLIYNILRPKNFIAPISIASMAMVLDNIIATHVLYALILSIINSLIVYNLKNLKSLFFNLTIIFTLYLLYYFGILSLLFCLYTFLIVQCVSFIKHRLNMYLFSEIDNNNNSFQINTINIMTRINLIQVNESKYLKILILRLFGLLILYLMVLNKFISETDNISNSIIITLNIYFWIVPSILIPLVLSTEYKYLNFLFIFNNFFEYLFIKLRAIIFVSYVQLTLAFLVFAFTVQSFKLFILIFTTGIFFSYIIIPIMFIAVCFTDEKIELMKKDLSNPLPSIKQSIIFFACLFFSVAFMLLLNKISFYFLNLILIAISTFVNYNSKLLDQIFVKIFYKNKFNILKSLN